MFRARNEQNVGNTRNTVYGRLKRLVYQGEKIGEPGTGVSLVP